MKRLNDLNAIIYQGISILFCFMMNMIMAIFFYFGIFELRALIFLTSLELFCAAHIWLCFLYTNVSFNEDVIQVENLFYLQTRSITDVKSIKESSLPCTFYIEFVDGKKARFYYLLGSIKRRFIDSTSVNIILDIKERMNLKHTE
jgi:hypothetical protein